MCIRDRFNTVSDKKIAVWGFAFKKDTNDTRESAAIYVCRDLLEERARITIYDPQVSIEQVRKDLEYLMVGADGELSELQRRLLEENVSVASSAEAAAHEAHAIAVMTEWDEFRDADFKSIYGSMMKPAFVFDGRNILDAQKLTDLGFEIASIGKGEA